MTIIQSSPLLPVYVDLLPVPPPEDVRGGDVAAEEDGPVGVGEHRLHGVVLRRRGNGVHPPGCSLAVVPDDIKMRFEVGE